MSSKKLTEGKPLIFFSAIKSIQYIKLHALEALESISRYEYQQHNFFHLSVYMSVYLIFKININLYFNKLFIIYDFLFHRQDS